ncbi:hypothetical protein [Streptomyces sp. NPDC047706]|uniref:hypothetical protein n=1 Tax=Streptomyces sp. NPDC047706 TaxID=3365486 RepID=UPI00370F7FE5
MLVGGGRRAEPGRARVDGRFEGGFRTGLLIGCGVAAVSAAVALLIPAVRTACGDDEKAGPRRDQAPARA